MRSGTIGALAGIAAAHAQTRRLTRDQALAEIADTLRHMTAAGADRQAALDQAAAGYAAPEYAWEAVAFDLLVAAGADETRARLLRGVRSGGGLSGLGERAGELKAAEDRGRE